MGLDRQLEELCSVYNERSDAELLSMHENRDDLTELAQDALAQVMRERRLSVTGVPVSTPATANSPEASELSLDDDEVILQNFDDAFRLQEAIRILTGAEIAHRVVNLDEGGTQSSGAYRPVMQLALIVGKTDESQARELLQAEMKLFPLSEGDDTFAELDGLMVVDVFGRSDALRIAHALGSAGISFLWNDGRENLTMTEDEVRIEVYLRHLEEAQKLAQQTLGR